METGNEKSACVEVCRLTKKYGTRYAVKDLSFSVASGEIFGIAGTNGAGKSTTLRALIGLIPINEGSLLVLGKDVFLHPLECRQNVAYIPELLNPFPFLTVWEHLQFTALAYNIKSSDEEFSTLLQTMELLDRANQLASTLSRGMLQKMFFACALLRKPSVIIFDEPFTGLDPKGIRLVKGMLREAARAGTGILICSHLLPLLEEVCERVLILDQGQNLACGRIDELRLNQGLPNNATLEELFFNLVEAREKAALCNLL